MTGYSKVSFFYITILQKNKHDSNVGGEKYWSIKINQVLSNFG